MEPICQGGEAVPTTQTLIGHCRMGRGGAARTEKKIKVKAYRDLKWVLLRRIDREPGLHGKLSHTMAANQEARLPRIWGNGGIGQSGTFELYYLSSRHSSCLVLFPLTLKWKPRKGKGLAQGQVLDK